MRRSPSLRTQLYVWLLVPMLLLVGVSSWLAHGSATEMAQAVSDRVLLGSARMIGEAITSEEGRLHAELPPSALENLHTGERDHAYYRVDAGPDNLLLGVADFPRHAQPLQPEQSRGYDTTYRGERVRALAYAQPVYPFGPGSVAIVQVAVTQRGLDALARRIWLRSVWPQAALLAAVALLGWFWVRVALRPVTRISAQVRNRELESSAPIVADDAPQELRPLVQAINDYIERIGQYVGERGRFISNAAHQLKTPITVLNTQITVGLRSEGPEPKQQALAGSYQTVQHCIRLIHQLLTLSSAEHTLVPRIEPSVVPLGDVVREVLEDFAERAHGKNIDLGLGAETEDAQVRGVPLMLRELVANLVDNALRYTPEEGTVTVSVLRRDGEVWLEVEDSGPGIPAAERERVFERFYRLADTAHEEGSGLGLAIVREIAMACGARIELGDRADGAPGLLVRVVFS